LHENGLMENGRAFHCSKWGMEIVFVSLTYHHKDDIGKRVCP